MRAKRKLVTDFQPHNERIDPPSLPIRLDQHISVSEAASFIAELETENDGARRKARDRAAKRLKGANGPVLSSNGETVAFGELLRWIVKGRNAKNATNRLEGLEDFRFADGIDDGAMGVPSVFTIPRPLTVAECHEVIRNAYLRIFELENQLSKRGKAEN